MHRHTPYSQIKLAEDDKKKLLGVKCPFYGCFVKGYVTNKAKWCQYHSCYDDDEIKHKMNTYLQKKYIQRITVSVVNTHLASPIPEIASMASEIVFTEGLQILNLLFINHFLGKE